MQIHLLTELVHNPRINARDTFTVICGHAQSRETTDSPDTTFSAEVEQDDTLVSILTLRTTAPFAV